MTVNSLTAPMEAAEFASIGESLWGPEWKPHAARLLGCNLSSVKRWATGAYRVPPGVALQRRVAVAGVTAVRALPAILDVIDTTAKNGSVADLALSEKVGDDGQALANDMLIAAVARIGRRAKFKRETTTADTPEDRALEAALARPGSRA